MPIEFPDQSFLLDPPTTQDTAFGVIRDVVHSRGALHEQMVDVARSAVTEIATADGVGVTLMAGSAVLMTAGSVDFVIDVDAVQYGLDEGPCLSAVHERRTQWTGALGTSETRWPRFGPSAAQLGVRSVASFPLIVASEVIGSVNAYAFEQDAFDRSAIDRGETFAGVAAVAVHNAQMLATTRLLQAQLGQTLTERSVIESAVGVLMFRGDITAVEAHVHLRQIADLHHLELSVVARVILTDAAVWSGNARAVLARAWRPDRELDAVDPGQ